MNRSDVDWRWIDGVPPGRWNTVRWRVADGLCWVLWLLGHSASRSHMMWRVWDGLCRLKLWVDSGDGFDYCEMTLDRQQALFDAGECEGTNWHPGMPEGEA
jgi:hypothetical protein